MRFWAVRVGVLVVGMVLTGVCSGQNEGARLVAVSPEQVKGLRGRLDAGMLPKGASHLEMTKGQTFQLTDGGQSVLMLVPVEFYVMTEGAFLSVCGLYMLPAAGAGRFVVTHGMTPETEDTDVEDGWECARTTAMGVMPKEGAHPRLLLTMASFSPPRHEAVVPIVLTWDAGKGSYVVGKQVFHDDSFVGDATVGKMRQKLLAGGRR